MRCLVMKYLNGNKVTHVTAKTKLIRKKKVCVYYIFIFDFNITNRVLLCYRNQKHAENEVKSMLLRLAHILLQEILKCYFCYM